MNNINQLSELSLYIHWPFCLHKCPYCDFNSHVREQIAPVDAWAAAYKSELEFYAVQTGRRQLCSIFFGGGTPSLMLPELVAGIIAHAATLWDFSPDIEITLEANPTSTEAGKFRAFRAAGVNRVSIGVQSLRQKELAFLGRQHDVAGAIRAIETAREVFPRYSFDLIYARPGQTLEDWRQELAEASALIGGHMSLYQLTIEKGTPFYSAYQKHEWALPDEETSAAMYELTSEVMGLRGLQAYEISNYAKPGEESRHNLAYWRYAEYAGIGPGAHGRICHSERSEESHPAGDSSASGLRMTSRTATMAIHHPERWLEAVQQRGHGQQSVELLPPEDILSEMLMMGTRLKEGIPRSRFVALCGAQPEAVLNARKLELFTREELLDLDATRLALTERGRMLHQRIVAELLD